MFHTAIRTGALGVAALALLATAPASAQDDGDAEAARNCTADPATVDEKRLVERGFVVVDRTNMATREYILPQPVLADLLYYEHNGVTYRAVYLAPGHLFHHPGASVPARVCGYVMGYRIDGANGFAAPMQWLPLSVVTFLDGPPPPIE